LLRKPTTETSPYLYMVHKICFTPPKLSTSFAENILCLSLI
jgi:hypothetical protein